MRGALPVLVWFNRERRVDEHAAEARGGRRGEAVAVS